VHELVAHARKAFPGRTFFGAPRLCQN